MSGGRSIETRKNVSFLRDLRALLDKHNVGIALMDRLYFVSDTFGSIEVTAACHWLDDPETPYPNAATGPCTPVGDI